MRSLFFVVSITLVLSFFFLQCETNPVDKLHSKDLVVVTLKNRKKRKEKRRRRKNVKNFTPKMVRALRSSLMRFSFYARAWCILPPLLLLPPLLSLQLHFSITHPPFFLRFLSLFFFSNETINWEKVDSTNWHCSCGQSIDMTVNRFEYINSISNFDRSH